MSVISHQSYNISIPILLAVRNQSNRSRAKWHWQDVPKLCYTPCKGKDEINKQCSQILQHAKRHMKFLATLLWSPLYTGHTVIRFCADTHAVYGVKFIALLSLSAAAPLTPDTVIQAVKEVDLKRLCGCLCVPDSKRDKIKVQYPPNAHRMGLVGWWFSTYPAPSWRRLIHGLDLYSEGSDTLCRKTADKIRGNAEPVQGMLSADGRLKSFLMAHQLSLPIHAQGGKTHSGREVVTQL